MSKRILVIDDSSTIQKVIRIAFAPYDVRIDIAGHFVEGLNAARQLQPDLVLADANLAGVRSVRDFQRLADEARGVPLVLLYGSYDQVDEQLFREAGFTMFIRKPFESRDIVMSVKRVLGHDFARKPATTQNTKMPSQSASPAAQNESPASPKVMDGLLGAFAAKPKVQEPAPVQTHQDDWLSSAEPEVDIPQDANFGVDPLMMDGLIAQTLTDNSRKGERAFSVEMPIPSQAGAVKTSGEAPGRMPPPNLPPLPAQLDYAHGRDMLATAKAPETQGFKAPSSEELSELLRPILREELARMVSEAVDEYCDRHFPGVARDVITAEIRRLTDEKTRHLVD